MVTLITSFLSLSPGMHSALPRPRGCWFRAHWWQHGISEEAFWHLHECHDAHHPTLRRSGSCANHRRNQNSGWDFRRCWKALCLDGTAGKCLRCRWGYHWPNLPLGSMWFWCLSVLLVTLQCYLYFPINQTFLSLPVYSYPPFIDLPLPSFPLILQSF